jgi:lipoate-protein ligase A
VALFNRLLVYRDWQARAGPMNMAVDEALLLTTNVAALRFYDWQRPAVSFGYFNRFSDVANYSDERELVRRTTGGGVVLHGSDLTYSIIVPASDPFYGHSATTSYSLIHQAIGTVLEASGHHPALAAESALKTSAACFANPARADVVLNGRKIAGAAQRRTKAGLLHQGSIQFGELPLDFSESLVAELSSDALDAALSDELIARANTLAAEKYATPQWLRRL